MFEMAEGIEELVTLGCDVIVEDIGTCGCAILLLYLNLARSFLSSSSNKL